MQLRYLLAASVASISLVGGMTTPVMAQETTSAISGQVTGDGDAPVAAAKITVVHVPSGTTATTTTDSGGSFSLRGLRVGGPYTITIDATGYSPTEIDGASLTVGDTLGVPVHLTEHEIKVTGASSGTRQLVEGSQSSFKADQIQNIVSARRDIRDIVRRDLLAAYNPNVGGVSIAGGNIRTQRFSVDGVQLQDSFGLNYGGLPSLRGIVSLEMIDQLTVKAAPFDVSEGNFQGGAVNVVLKSGTNHFHVTGFGNFGGPTMTGDLTRDNRILGGANSPVGKTTIFDFRNYGGSISGPIIKDVLFFSGGYEKLTEGTSNPNGYAGSANPIPGLTQAAVDNLTSIFNTAGYDKYNIGTVVPALTESDKKYAAKIDWNVASGQRFSATWIHHENTLPNFGVAGTTTGSTSATTGYIQLQSNLYKLTEFTNAYTAQLDSQWSDRFSTELRGAYKYYRRGQDAYFGPDYAQFNVCLDPTSTPFPGANNANFQCNPGSPIVRAGPDTPRQANKFHSKQLTVTGNAQLKAGDHTFKLEYDYSHTQIYNLFVYAGNSPAATGLSGGGSGAIYVDSLADFAARDANEFSLTTTTTGNKNDGAVDWGYAVHTVGFQDTWRPSAHFTANAGVRLDMYASDSSGITYNPSFASRYGFSNQANYNGRLKVQPRAGFNWSPDPTVKISGGAGLFEGGLSDVFMSNNYSNSGVAVNSTGAAITAIDIRRTGGTAAAPTCVDNSNPKNGALPAALCAAALTNIAGGSVPQAVIDYAKTSAQINPNATTNSLDPHFRLPAQWKFNLSGSWSPHLGDSLLASGWTFRADVLYSRVQDGLRWTDLRSVPLVVGGVAQVAPDGRPRYTALIAGGAYDIQLTNTTKGMALVWAVGANKALGDFDLSTSYTHQHVKDVAGILVSSTGPNNLGIPTSDPNSGGDYGRSAFEVKHTIRADFEFHHNFFEDVETRFGLNLEARSGQPFSVTMNDNQFASPTFTPVGCNSGSRACVFGTTNTTAHLLYVPDFSQAASNTTLIASDGTAYSAPQLGTVIFGTSLAPSTANPHPTSAQYTASAAANLAVLQAQVLGSGLKKYQGAIAPKNALSGPWYYKMDLNFAQQIPFFHHSKFTALLSIENFLNLLNRNWGSYQDYGASQALVFVSCAGTTTNGQTCPQYIYTSANSKVTTTTLPKYSLYAIRAGVRFDF